MFNYVISNLEVMTIFAKLSSFGVRKEFMLSKALVLFSQLISLLTYFICIKVANGIGHKL